MIETPEIRFARVSRAAKPTAIPITPAEASQAVPSIFHKAMKSQIRTPINKTLTLISNNGRVRGCISPVPLLLPANVEIKSAIALNQALPQRNSSKVNSKRVRNQSTDSPNTNAFSAATRARITIV
jgi:hypothetical protein